MICCSIGHKSARQIEAILRKVEMAELRLDLCDLSEEEIENIFSSSDTPLIATCRTVDGDYHKAERLLTLAIKAGARYADLEIDAPKPVSKRIANACAEWGTTLIRSYHNYGCTPSLDELRAVADKCRHHDGEVVKIVTSAQSPEDADTVLALYRYYTAESLVAFAMGEAGTKSRIKCLEKGAPFSYAAVDGDASGTASGQMPYSEMYRAVYGERKALDAAGLRAPASKSFAQRAILAAALAEGVSVLKGYTPCGDSESALKVAKEMGASVKKKRGAGGTVTLEITGIGGAAGEFASQAGSAVQERVFHVGESGLLTRLLMPLGCALFPDGIRIEGEGTLLQRPLQGAAATMEALGCKVDVDGEQTDITVPFALQGPLRPGRIETDGSRSSQLVSGALMALPLCAKNSTLHVMNPVSIPYIYITLDILRRFGVKVRSEMYCGRQLLDGDWSKCTEIVLKIKENQRYRAAELDLEGDWSAAAPFLAAGAVYGGVSVSGLDTSSLQADLTVMDILVDAGASVSQTGEPGEVPEESREHDPRFKVPGTLRELPNNGSPGSTATSADSPEQETTGVITVKKAPLQGIKADLTNCPDLFPVTAVLCAFCQGKSVLRGVHRLSHKESDRAEGIKDMLCRMGVKAQIKDDDLIVEGESLDSRILNGRLLKGGKFTSSHDHRMVMALRLAEPGADSPVEIDDEGCVGKSFPSFNEIWKNRISYE